MFDYHRVNPMKITHPPVSSMAYPPGSPISLQALVAQAFVEVHGGGQGSKSYLASLEALDPLGIWMAVAELWLIR